MDRIDIYGYKSIKSLELPLRPINVIIGANGSGKSNLLSFFELLKNISEKKLQSYVSLRGGTDKLLHKGGKVTNEISSKIYFGHNDYSFTIQQGDEAFVFTKEGLWYDSNPYKPNPTDISSHSFEANIKDSDNYRAQYIRGYLNGYEKYHFHDTSANSPFNKTSNIENDKFFLYSKGDNIAAYLFHIQNTTPLSYQLIIRTIQSVAPYFSDFYLKPDENNQVKLRWTDKFSSTIYGVTDLSDGTIRFIALCTLFLQPQLPSTIIIDEPELGLHPTAIAKLASLIKSAAAKNSQVIVATQSTDLISHFEPEDIVTVDLIDGESKFKRLDSEELRIWLEDYTIDELWKRNIIPHGHPHYSNVQ